MKKILVVDDEAFNRDIIKKVLIKEGFSILEASNGMESLSILESNKIDLILMDIMMPIMDGFKAIEAIKKENIYKNLPIIAITALSDKQTQQKILKLGAKMLIAKPFELPILIDSVKSTLKEL